VSRRGREPGGAFLPFPPTVSHIEDWRGFGWVTSSTAASPARGPRTFEQIHHIPATAGCQGGRWFHRAKQSRSGGRASAPGDRPPAAFRHRMRSWGGLRRSVVRPTARSTHISYAAADTRPVSSDPAQVSEPISARCLLGGLKDNAGRCGRGEIIAPISWTAAGAAPAGPGSIPSRADPQHRPLGPAEPDAIPTRRGAAVVLAASDWALVEQAHSPGVVGDRTSAEKNWRAHSPFAPHTNDKGPRPPPSPGGWDSSDLNPFGGIHFCGEWRRHGLKGWEASEMGSLKALGR